MKLKLYAYAVLVILAIWFGWGFYSNYSAVAKAAADSANNSETQAPVPQPPTVGTNSDASTNTASASTNATTSTNDMAQSTNPPPAQTNLVATKPSLPPATGPSMSARRGAMMGYLAAFIGAVIGLGLLVAMDLTQFMGSQAVDFILDGKGEGLRDPEYEKAEAMWANGNHLEAIQMMRDFLKNNPREQYAALRIAEIYEKDLHNIVAAALEYEEILKNKLPPDRWSWSAIHLCNLYTKLNQQDKAVALLQRIADEYPKTAAAQKARSRLGLPEPEGEPAVEPEAPETAPPAPPPPPKSNLPPGFRPK